MMPLAPLRSWPMVLWLTSACGTATSGEGGRDLTLEPSASVPTPEFLDADASRRFAGLALACVHREYPNKISHVMNQDADARPPRELYPVFHGCFDWHSAVHGHWLLARLARLRPSDPWVGRAKNALGHSLTEEKIAGELAYLSAEGRGGFERPYGLAWLLQLSAELREWNRDPARQWVQRLEPLERLVAERLRQWLVKLSHPIRSGEHSQTAFAMGLALDWSRVAADRETERVLVERAVFFHGRERDCALHLEPSGHDFLSPCLGAADLMRRVLAPPDFAAWLTRALPSIPSDGAKTWLLPVVPADRTDGKLVHLDGLNLSRAWMLEGIAHGLPPSDGRRSAVLSAAREHARAGLDAMSGQHYEGGHWLGSFATYLVSRRGLPAGG